MNSASLCSLAGRGTRFLAHRLLKNASSAQKLKQLYYNSYWHILYSVHVTSVEMFIPDIGFFSILDPRSQSLDLKSNKKWWE
jgi:hypothetical protein